MRCRNRSERCRRHNCGGCWRKASRWHRNRRRSCSLRRRSSRRQRWRWWNHWHRQTSHWRCSEERHLRSWRKRNGLRRHRNGYWARRRKLRGGRRLLFTRQEEPTAHCHHEHGERYTSHQWQASSVRSDGARWIGSRNRSCQPSGRCHRNHRRLSIDATYWKGLALRCGAE